MAKRGPKPKKEERDCIVCGATVLVTPCRLTTFKYCSRKCFGEGTRGENNYIHKRPDVRELRSKLQKGFPRPYQEGEKHGNWKGGKTKQKIGYILVKTDANKRDYEHRVLMEKKLGRKLKNNEIIHHIDGDKSNNSIPNLKLFSNQSEHLKEHHRIS